MTTNQRRIKLAELLKECQAPPNYINGKYADGQGPTFQTNDPYSGDLLAKISEAGSIVVSDAVAAAQQAQDSWRLLPPRQRATYLYAIADWIEANSDRIAHIEAADTGKLFQGVEGWDVPNAAEVFRYYAGWCDKIDGSSILSEAEVSMRTEKRPIGVVAAITPWNFPLACASWKVAPALAAGCTVVLKPSERAPMHSVFYAEAAEAVGLPAGVLNIVQGDGKSTGTQLVANPKLAAISFTGSAETLREIVQTSIGHLPKILAELGGKGAFIVCDDADIDSLISDLVEASFGIAGQNCCAASRILLQESIADQVINKLVQAVEHRTLGDNFDDATSQGPQIDQAHRKRISEIVDSAVADGATKLTTAETDDRFYPPTLLDGVSSQTDICQTEVFGPLATIERFTSVEEAVSLVNDTAYGLSASVWTANPSRSQAFTRALKRGTVWVNCFGYFDTSLPWGGLGLSGYGKEFGKQGILEFFDDIAIAERW